MAHPIRPSRNLDGQFHTATVYEKGADGRLYHTLLGAGGFRRGMISTSSATTARPYLRRLRAAMADANGVDLARFERVQPAGTPRSRQAGRGTRRSQAYSLSLRQSCRTTGRRAARADADSGALGLLGADGGDLPLASRRDGPAPTTRVVVLESTSDVSVEGIAQAPVAVAAASVFRPWCSRCAHARGAGVPAAHDSDPVSRWGRRQDARGRSSARAGADVAAGRPLALAPDFVAAMGRCSATRPRRVAARVMLALPNLRCSARRWRRSTTPRSTARGSRSQSSRGRIARASSDRAGRRGHPVSGDRVLDRSASPAHTARVTSPRSAIPAGPSTPRHSSAQTT